MIALRLLFSSLALVLLFAGASFAQEVAPPFEAIDRHALSTPETETDSIERLATYLTLPAANDAEKARAIFRWVTANIEYDVPSLLDGSYATNPSDGASVLLRRRDICEGYANLFRDLARAAGLEAELVRGFSKGFNHRPGDPITEHGRHMWNAVKIDGAWQLLDATWGAGNLVGEKFARKFNDFYFLTTPAKLVHSHLPREDRWQLLRESISRERFERLPELEPRFFQFGIKLVSHATSVIESGSELQVLLRAPVNMQFRALLTDLAGNKIPENYVFAQRQQDAQENLELSLRLPVEGAYLLRVYAAPLDKEKLGHVLSYRIDARFAPDQSREVAFPQRIRTFEVKPNRLYFPMNGSLKAGEAARFKLFLPEALDALVTTGGSFFFLESKGNGFFEGSVKIANGPVDVTVQYPGQKYRQVLLKYNGQP